MRKVSCVVCEASRSCPFTALRCEERSPLSSLIQHQLYQKGETIFHQGAVISGLYVLCDGKVKLARCTSDGHKQIIKLLGDGDLFGELGLWEAQASSVSAQALADSVVGWLSLGDFQELLKRYPPMALGIQRRLAQEIGDLYVRLAERAYARARERLIKLLLELGAKYGRESDQGLQIDLELTERDIAEMLGNTPEWVCKQLGVLKRRGLIAYRRGELVILDEVELRRYLTPPRERRAPFWSGKRAMIERVH